jgi:hypothetical protein
MWAAHMALVAVGMCTVSEAALNVQKGGAVHFGPLWVSLGCPTFVMNDATSAGARYYLGPMRGNGDAAGPLEVSYRDDIRMSDGSLLEVVLMVQQSSEDGCLRKGARFQLKNAPAAKVLKEVVIEDMSADRTGVRLSPGEGQSYPAFVDGGFLGIEFPIASTRIENGRFLLAYRPGLKVEPGVWYETRKAVYGLAPKGEERQAFHGYILAHRPAPHGMHVNYNSWWTAPAPYYTEKDILDLMQTFEEKLYKPHHVSFDTFCIDMGWSNPKSLWEIDPKLFPEGFTRIQQAAERMNCRLGLWISPCSGYPPALDNAWAKENGYEAMNGALCLGGRKYQTAFRDRLVELVTKYRIRHIKLDGYRFECPETGHGHEPGLLSADAIAQGIIDAAQAVHRAAPDTWLEPTCFGYNPSPWWLGYFNSVIGSFGDDAPQGRVPAPVYRESYTTARDFFNLQGAYWNAGPQAAQEVLGVIHQSEEPFLNDAVMTVMRGHQFLPVYLNPKYMNEHWAGPDTRWEDLAAVLQWARANAPILEATVPILPPAWRDGKCPKFDAHATMPREPYGYAHWKDDHGLIAVRNPWIAPQTISLGLRQAGIPLDASALSVDRIYPEPSAEARCRKSGDVLEFLVLPYETAVFSLRKGVSQAESLGRRQYLRLKSRKLGVVRTEYEGPKEAYGPDWTSLVGDAPSGTSLAWDAELEYIQDDIHNADLLVLFDGVCAQQPGPVSIQLDGKPVTPGVTGSETGWSASGMERPEHWVFLRVPLCPLPKTIRMKLQAPDSPVKVSAWIWVNASGRGVTSVLPPPEVISLGIEPLLPPMDVAATTPDEVVRIPRPVERINGIFLDALEPVSATQGWGMLQKNQSVWEKPMTIAGTSYRRGLGTHAPSKIVYALEGKYKRFQAMAGADAATSPTITFEVWVDGQKRWESGLMTRDTSAKTVDIDVAGAKALELVVGDAGNGIMADHADWADARLLR